ncbi:MAG: Inositol 2-dehydrogenase/D-chiro-inositol 3-dehydrogenase [Phycisphaerae bacterium]|nr:Inositol 2-dehydrogenase/D-chiro-inositol 3-dehydrogenase [Phycisphaerae bacterium]
MKQVLNDMRGGQVMLADVPAPRPGRGQLLIQSRRTLISAGTEKMLVEFGKASLLAKVRSQPDRVKQVLDKIKTDGLLPTLEAVFTRLGEPMPLGYCNAGVVLEVGPGVAGFAPGDRVVSNGPHAEIVCVPRNLCAKIPDGVTDEQAAFTVLASIGLQGVRLAAPALGETFVVVGLGLIGLVTAQLLRASGGHVIGTDVNPARLALAESFGVQTVNVGAGGDPVAAAMSATGGRGADGVIITASAKTDEIIHQAAEMCRKRGRIVLVGVIGLNLRRTDFYEKELTFQVSCSYGPGRYDEAYEQGGQDYPVGFVRWTEQRNFEAVLAALADGSLKVDPLISNRFAFSEAPEAYEAISGGSTLGVVLEYPEQADRSTSITLRLPDAAAQSVRRVVVGVIGAGNFSKMTLIPALVRTGADIKYIADLDGRAAAFLAGKGKARQAVTDYKLILGDPEINAVIIAVGHSLHARMVVEALAAGKHVMVEKPLAMNTQQVADILAAVRAAPGLQVMVGFNRRFSPHSVKVRELLAGRSEPLAMRFLANAGIIPPEHWVHDPVRGGGRIIGEACHYIDLLSFYAGSPVRTVAATMMGEGVAVRVDKMSITLGFQDGSVGTVDYFANGPRNFPKERAELFSQGRAVQIDNFRKTVAYGFGGFKRLKTRRQDKGHRAEFAAFVDRVAAGGQPLIPLDQLVNATLASFAAMTAATERRTVVLADEYADLLSGGGAAPSNK